MRKFKLEKLANQSHRTELRITFSKKIVQKGQVRNGFVGKKLMQVAPPRL